MTALQDVSAAVFELTETLRLAIPDPLDQIRLLVQLARYGLDHTVPVGSSPITIAQGIAQRETAALCRRSALVSLARAASAYDPPSSTEASATLARILPLYDREILAAGDAGDDETYRYLRALRAAVSNDLQSRGVRRPDLITVIRAQSQPSVVIAYALYEDAARSDELVRRVDPIHPLMMPTQFVALSA